MKKDFEVLKQIGIDFEKSMETIINWSKIIEKETNRLNPEFTITLEDIDLIQDNLCWNECPIVNQKLLALNTKLELIKRNSQ